MSTLRDRLPIFLTGFAIGTLIAVWMFIRVARESIPLSPEEAITVERTPLPDTNELPELPPGWEPYRAFVEKIEGDGTRDVVWLRNPDGGLVRLQRGHLRAQTSDLSEVSDRTPEWEWVFADRLEIEARPRIETRVMLDGFRHTGYDLMENAGDGIYIVAVDRFPDDAMARARYFLLGRERFIAEVRFVPWPDR